MRTAGGRFLRIAIAALTIAALAVACIPPRPSPTPAPSTVEPPTTAVQSPSTDPSSTGIVVDPSLLDILPADVAGMERTADPDTAAEVARQALLDRFISGIAIAIYPSTADYAVATVARLRPEVFDEEWFRDWRDTFDAGVCEQAGGVDTGRSELELGGHTVHRSTCVGGVVIYHVWLPERGAVVSVQGAGPLDVGRSIVSGLTE